MSLITVTSPHATGKTSTGQVMRQVVYAAVPGLLVLTFAFGLGVLVNVLWCIALGLMLEAGCLRARGKPVAFFLKDWSAVVTGLLLGLAIPSTSPWWLSMVGMIFAIPVAKHLYGGLGSNPFNPAMVAYALLLVSFPAEMTRWAAFSTHPSVDVSWLAFLGQTSGLDQLTGATPLDSFRLAARQPLTGNDWFSDRIQLAGWGYANLAFLLGGLYLMARKIISWHIPAALLVTLGTLATVFYLADSAHFASPLFHALSGATMLGAFFIATDPVSASTSRRGQLVYGAGIGALIYIIRTWGGYPDAVAFAVLLMNLAAPTIDHLLQPRTFGHDVRPVKWKGSK